jgi:deazaflavin-dependent oxidoreductase (nitroreductase family)
MPLPRRLGRFNARVTNRILGPVATLLPWFVWLHHRGRRTGTPYRTPLMLFGSGPERVIAMTYGPEADWARNVLAAGGAVATGRGARRLALTAPRLVHDPTRRLVPPQIRPVLWLLGASDFLVLEVASAEGR